MRDLHIDADRLYASLDQLGRVGAFRDEYSGRDGVRRVALTDADREGRRLVRSWFEAAGLQVSVDRIGNVYGQRGGVDDTHSPVMT